MDVAIAKLIDPFDDNNELTVREAYSGRGMFGRETGAITAPDWSTFVQVLGSVMMAARNEPDVVERIGQALYNDPPCAETMGYEIVIY